MITILLVGLSVVIFLFSIFKFYKSKKEKAKENEKHRAEIEEILQYFLKWNRSVPNKQTMQAFYVEFAITMQELTDESFRINLTKEEFEKLSLKSLRELNQDALTNMLYSLKA